MLTILKKNITRIFSIHLLNFPVALAVPAFITSESGVDIYGWYALWWSCMVNGIQLVNSYCSGMLIYVSRWSINENKKVSQLWVVASSIQASFLGAFLLVCLLLGSILFSFSIPSFLYFASFIFCAASVPSVLYQNSKNNFHIKFKYEVLAKYMALIGIIIVGFLEVETQELYLGLSAVFLAIFRFLLQLRTYQELSLNMEKKLNIFSKKRTSLKIVLKRLHDYGRYSSVTSIANFVSTAGFYILVGILSDLRTLGFFALIIVPINILNQLFRTFSMILVPNISMLIREKNFQEVVYYFVNSRALCLMATFAISMALFLGLPLVIKVVAEEYLSLVAPLFMCSVARLAYLSTTVEQNFLRANNRPEVQASISAISIAAVPCLLLLYIGEGAKLVDVAICFSVGQFIGAILFYAVSFPTLQKQFGQTGLQTLVVNFFHATLIGVLGLFYILGLWEIDKF